MTNLFKPIVNLVKTFDPKFSNLFTFSYDGNQPHSNRLVITDNETNEIVYDATEKSMRLAHTVPGGKLKSNRQYTVQVQCFDSSNTASPLSDKIYFFCVTTPTLTFVNIVDPIENSSYPFTARYEQKDGEKLKEYTYYLWDYSGKVIQTSGTLYGKADTSEISHTFTALEDNNIYKVQIVGVTVHGMTVEAEIQIHVDYLRPSQYATFYAENDSTNALIRYNTNIIVIQYNGNETFEYENGCILLSDKKLYYDAGFNLSGDFEIKLRGFGFQTGTEIFKAKNEDNEFHVDCIADEEGNAKFMLTVNNMLGSYILFSNSVDVNTNNMITIVIRRKNNLYLIGAIEEFGETNAADLYYGRTYPETPNNYAAYIYDDNFETVMVDSATVQIFEGSEEPEFRNNLDLWLQEVDS